MFTFLLLTVRINDSVQLCYSFIVKRGTFEVDKLWMCQSPDVIPDLKSQFHRFILHRFPGSEVNHWWSLPSQHVTQWALFAWVESKITVEIKYVQHLTVHMKPCCRWWEQGQEPPLWSSDLTVVAPAFKNSSSSRNIRKVIHLLCNERAFLYMCPTALNEISMAVCCRGNLDLCVPVEITGPASI